MGGHGRRRRKNPLINEKARASAYTASDILVRTPHATADNFYFKPAYHRDGLSATVTVGYNGPRAPYLKVNGKTDASVGSAHKDHVQLQEKLDAE